MLQGKCLIKAIPKERKIELIKHRRRRTETKEGEVIECGTKNAEARVAKGSRVFFSGYSGRKLKRDGVEYLVLDESEILGVAI